MQQMAHPDGERATSKAAHRHGALMTLSSWSTLPLEEVAAAAPGGYRWFQLYVYKDRAVTLDLVKRAQKAGYVALAVTVDTPILGRREADIRNKFSLPAHLTMGNFAKLGGAHASGTKSAGSSGSGLASYVVSWPCVRMGCCCAHLPSTGPPQTPANSYVHPQYTPPKKKTATSYYTHTPHPSPQSSLIDRTLTWDDIAWLRTVTTMKIVVKGVLGTDDALAAVKVCRNLS